MGDEDIDDIGGQPTSGESMRAPHLSPDGRWWWDGARWVPANQPAPPPAPTTLRLSPDGRYQWNGQAWVPVVPTSPVARPAAPATSRSRGKTWLIVGLAIAVAVALFVGATLASDDGADSAAAKDASASAPPSPEPSEQQAEVEEAQEPDADGDGTPDSDDIRPNDPAIQDKGDLDPDGDGVPNSEDDFPRNPKYSKDSDGDGVADSEDYRPEDPEIQNPPKPAVYTGTGTDVIKIKKPGGSRSIGVAKISHQGGSNFVVWSLDKRLNQNELLVNTIGSYKGTVLFDIRRGDNSSRFEIEADGPWRIELVQVDTVRSFTKSIRGSGDDVVYYADNGGIAQVANQGRSNFVIWKYGDDSDLLVNEIGPYRARVPVRGTGLLAIEAEGPWSISVR